MKLSTVTSVLLNQSTSAVILQYLGSFLWCSVSNLDEDGYPGEKNDLEINSIISPIVDPRRNYIMSTYGAAEFECCHIGGYIESKILGMGIKGCRMKVLRQWGYYFVTNHEGVWPINYTPRLVMLHFPTFLLGVLTDERITGFNATEMYLRLLHSRREIRRLRGGKVVQTNIPKSRKRKQIHLYHFIRTSSGWARVENVSLLKQEDRDNVILKRRVVRSTF